MDAPSLEQLIGHELLCVIPIIHATQMQIIRLHRVEQGGIWIESNAMTQTVLRNMNAAAGKTPLFFVPFEKINFLMSRKSPCLSQHLAHKIPVLSVTNYFFWAKSGTHGTNAISVAERDE